MIERIEELEEQVEFWRQRAELAEAALKGDEWGVAMPPLTLLQTRVMRLLARRSMSSPQLVAILASEYERITGDAIKVHISRIRSVLPAEIAPSKLGNWFAAYQVADRQALRAFLSTDPEDERRAA